MQITRQNSDSLVKPETESFRFLSGNVVVAADFHHSSPTFVIFISFILAVLRIVILEYISLFLSSLSYQLLQHTFPRDFLSYFPTHSQFAMSNFFSTYSPMSEFSFRLVSFAIILSFELFPFNSHFISLGGHFILLSSSPFNSSVGQFAV